MRCRAGRIIMNQRISEREKIIKMIINNINTLDARKGIQGKRIIITAGNVTCEADIFPNETGNAIYESLPISGFVSRWGDEIYFSIPVTLKRSGDARDVVQKGELGYWPDGRAFCIFFGKTPASEGDEIRAASPVSVFGKITGDPARLTRVLVGEKINVAEKKGE